VAYVPVALNIRATGLTQVGARYYDEGLGQFIGAEPILVLSDPAQWNAYRTTDRS
jgi:hypothetical protein